MRKISTILAGLALVYNSASAQDMQGYQKPPQPIMSLLEAPVNPAVRISSDGEWMLLLEMPGLPSISELSQPELRLAGQRINPANNGQSRSPAYTGIKVKSISSGTENTLIGLPNEPRLANFTWSPDESKIAFTHNGLKGIELWVADMSSFQARRLSNFYLNETYGNSFIWNPDSKNLLAKFIDDSRQALPEQNLIPTGPVIQENTGKSAPVPTYQDLLKNPYDEKLFDYYFRS
ncbi:MAG: S9 family peptidase, partial [Pedobacter sp.]